MRKAFLADVYMCVLMMVGVTYAMLQVFCFLFTLLNSVPPQTLEAGIGYGVLVIASILVGVSLLFGIFMLPWLFYIAGHYKVDKP